MLNACQARFLNPRFYYAQGPNPPNSTEPNLSRPGPAVVQIGTEGGFLPAPVYLAGTSPLVPGGPTRSQLLLAPAVRADLIVDFRDVPGRAVHRARQPPAEGRVRDQGGAEYVWHCHILEHEEHDMMRPLVVTP